MKKNNRKKEEQRKVRTAAEFGANPGRLRSYV